MSLKGSCNECQCCDWIEREMGTHRTRRGLVLEQMNRLCGALFVLPLALVFVNGEEKESTGIPAPGGHVNCITADNKMQLMCLAGESGSDN